MSYIAQRMAASKAVHQIRKFWKYHPLAHFFHPIDVEFHPGTFEIKSNLVDGYPPRKDYA